jgi:hypothetical protein
LRRGNGVQRDAAIQARIVGEIYLFHSSGTQFSTDASLASTETRFDLLRAGRARRWCDSCGPVNPLLSAYTGGRW